MKPAWALVGSLAAAGAALFMGNWWLLGEPALWEAMGPTGRWLAGVRLVGGVGLAVAAGFGARWLQRSVIAPLALLRVQLAALRAGSYAEPQPLPAHTAPELLAVAADVGAVAQALREKQAQLGVSDDARRQAFDAMVAALADAVELNREARALNAALAGQKAAVEVEVARRTEELEAQRADLADANERLLELDRLKDQFLSILSHELRTPLNAVLGFASVLEDELAGPLAPEQHVYVARIAASGNHLIGMIEDLLDMSRIQAGKFALVPQALAFGPVVHDAIASVSALAARKRLKLEQDVAGDLPVLNADGQRLHQVLLNLLGNAVKFTPEGGAVTVRAWCKDPRTVRCEVADTGPGIVPADQARLFQPFTQLDMSNTRASGGTGLGLSIARALVEAHGGAIGVASAPGAGSVFWFELPADQAGVTR